MDLEPNQQVNVIAGGKAFDSIRSMLVAASNKVIGHANIERAVFPLGH